MEDLKNDALIEINDLTKDYGNNRGLFNINLNVNKGEMVGFVGTNGSGKTTTIRSILGFVKPTSGTCYVNGMESWTHQSEIAKLVGYVPGEIAFPDLKTGVNFLKSQAEYKGVTDLSYADQLIKELQLDPKANLKRMSKGMKQKTALVAALMADAPIIILDEPTTGLDPLMRDAFLTIIKREHEKGKTIFMSSHMFNEMEETCDRVALISDGHIIDIANMKEIRNRDIVDFKIEFNDKKSFDSFKDKGFNIIRTQEQFNQYTISIKKEKINDLFISLKGLNVKFISEVKYTLEKYFNEKMREN
ncbi:MAG: ATP-binding cassette domain-containing protein [Acholeplasmatales bacterium]|nr:ATP-binding cassette domain-containing protein [Acholeplasmatales bacterium]